MPTTLPVPSKGALRTLRNLALGTSCTVAFSAGLLTEDRRRRIHAAREVHDNAKKLKSSRKYHSTSTATVESFEDQVLRSREDAFWLPSKVAKSKAAAGIILGTAPEASVQKPQLSAQTTTPRFRRQEIAKLEALVATSSPTYPKSFKQQAHNRQHKLTFDVTRLLEDGIDSPDVDAAASRFAEAFEEGLPVEASGISQPLIDAALKLSKAGREQSKFEICEMVLDIISRNGPINEEQFQLFDPYMVLKRMVTGPAQVVSGQPHMDATKIEKAASIYLTRFKNKPSVMSEQMLSLGDRLCAETCRSGMYGLTMSLFFRLDSCRGHAPVRAADHLIKAAHAKGQHKKIFRYFQDFYTKTLPDQMEFYNTVELVINSILVTGKYENAEEVLVNATKMAEDGNILTSTTWLLKVLGHNWRTHRDIVRTRALFERMEPFLHATKHPQAVYGAIIQFCIEADQMPIAVSYYNKLRESHTPVPADVRIYGHFAFAKALKEDWDGVKEDLRNISTYSSGYEEEYCAAFAPILKVFAKSHSVAETEEFLKMFVDQYKLRLTDFMSNIMIDSYAKARELDAIARWIEYATSVGCPIDVATFNTLLSTFFKSWKFSFDQVYQIFSMVCKLHDGYARFTDQKTIQILRRIALADCPDSMEARRRLNCLKKFGKRSEPFDSQQAYRAMDAAFAKGEPAAALKLYKQAQKSQIFLDAQHLHVAVKASLQLHGPALIEPIRLIQDAQRKGLEVTSSMATIIVHKISELGEVNTRDTCTASKLAQKTISAMEEQGLQPPPCILTHAMSILESRGQYHRALDLWESMGGRPGASTSSLDLVTLTVLLKSYIGLQDPSGVQWVINMLSVNKIIPDKHMHVLLKNTRKANRDLVESQDCSEQQHRFVATIQEAAKHVVELRAGATIEKERAKFKTIQIMEKAIKDQAARGVPNLVITRSGSQLRLEDVISRDPQEALMEPGIESDEDSGSDVDLPPERRAIATAI